MTQQINPTNLFSNTVIDVFRPTYTSDGLGGRTCDETEVCSDLCVRITPRSIDAPLNWMGAQYSGTYILRYWIAEGCPFCVLCDGDIVEDENGKRYRILSVYGRKLWKSNHRITAELIVLGDSRFGNFNIQP